MGLGATAMFGDQYRLAAGLYFAGIALLTAKFLTWEEHRNLARKKRAVSVAIVSMIATAAFLASLYWITVRRADAAAQNKVPKVNIGATDSLPRATTAISPGITAPAPPTKAETNRPKRSKPDNTN